ncbi:MAG: hypothetical protein ACTSV1_04690 [Alphaproteobacteria bacterium]
MVFTVLTPYDPKVFGNASLLARMSAVFQSQASKKTEQINNSYQQKINSVEFDAKRWKNIEEDIEEARGEVVDARNRAQGVLNYINDAIREINKAEQNSGDSGFAAAGYAAAFDSRLRTIERRVNDPRTPGLNLLGKFEPDLSFNVRPSGNTATVAGQYVGNDYYIIDSDGNRWQPDSRAKILKQYSDYPDSPTSKAGNYATGLQLDSISGDTITFTVAPDTATPEQFTGTVYRSGTKVMNSWFYDGLETTDGRSRALADLGEAKEALTLEVTRYTTSLTTTEFYASMVDAEIKGYRGDTNELIIEQAQEVQRTQKLLQAQFLAASGNVARSFAVRKQYNAMLQPLLNDRVMRLFNLTV